MEEIKTGADKKDSLLVLPCFYCKQPSWRGKAAQINGGVVRGHTIFAKVIREY
jgi:hypothetical protein